MRTPASTRAFTLIEILVVIAVIMILAGLVLGTVGYVQNKGARSRAEAEIAAMSAALESYKADNGIYPQDTSLNARTPGNADPIKGDVSYRTATLTLYKALSGDTNADKHPTAKSYFSFTKGMVYPRGNASNVTALTDPWVNCYGYSTANQSDPSKGYNPTFDLWSSGQPNDNGTANTDPAKFVKNW
ncbi:MAG: prepilin-type N-terminal cleavage/methylation domain-containing protein [Verrucomicrobia bacterium]|nr:prepilin-type N-terminal cleavage/methylation domain-containing protein [Verrucomicrobiota bacterium]